MHSGRQLGGAPIIPSMQVQDGESPTARHCAFGPQGDGWQGLLGVICTGGSTERDQR